MTALTRSRQLYHQLMGVDKGAQLLLRMQYVQHHQQTRQLLRFDEIEFRTFSQNGEDGILLYIFALIGSTNKLCVEICAGSGIQCNTANLVINHGWTGVMFDGSEKSIAKGRKFYATHPDTNAFPPKLVCAWITAENVNTLLTSNGVGGDIDLLSLDIDGIDYWIWQSIEVIRPRVIVAEVQVILGPDAELSVPNDPTFVAEFMDGCGVYCGASIAAFIKLAKYKGYRFVGCQQYGFNAFFIRNDVAEDIFPEVGAQECFRHPFAQWAQSRFLPLVKDKPWIKV